MNSLGNRGDFDQVAVPCPKCNEFGGPGGWTQTHPGRWCPKCGGRGEVEIDNRPWLHRAWDATWNAVWMVIVFVIWVGFLLAMFALPAALGG